MAILFGPAATATYAQWDREGAEKSWDAATRLKAELSAAPKPTRAEYLKCIRLFQEVYYKSPHYTNSDDAVYQEALLYQEVGDRFGDRDAYRSAVKLYRFLTTDYNNSPYCSDAYLRLALISRDFLGDAQAAEEAFQIVRSRYKSSAAAATLAADPAAARPAMKPTTPVATKSAAPAEEFKAAPRRSTGPSYVNAVQFESVQGHSRVSIDLDAPVSYKGTRLANPDRVFFDLADSVLVRSLLNKSIPVEDKFLQQIRIGQNQHSVVRIVLDLNTNVDYVVSTRENPPGLVIDVGPKGKMTAASTPSPAATQPVVRPGTPAAAAPAPKRERADTATRSSVREEALDNRSGAQPDPVDLNRNDAPGLKSASSSAPVSASTVRPSGAAGNPGLSGEASLPPKSALPTKTGDRTLTRMLGLKISRIVIDPGHGGHDTGTIGPGGLMEKDLVFQLALELKKMLENNLGAEVILTRSGDVYIPLEERTALANQNQADLFVSIHANSSPSRKTSGVETYFLDFARNDEAREVAARENAAANLNISDLQALVQKIARADRMQESRELAAIIQQSLYRAMRGMIPSCQDRGVRSAPFVVLIGADMPSVLAEVAFLSNPRDEKLLRNEVSQQSTANALFRGIEGYMKTLGAGIAQNHDKSN